jgi:hypothetical protein
MLIDCDTCTARGVGCDDCVVTVLLGGPPVPIELDSTEAVAIGRLAAAGLVPPLRLAVDLAVDPAVDAASVSSTYERGIA